MDGPLEKLNKISWWVELIVKIAMVLLALAIFAVCVMMAVAAFDPDLLLNNIPELNTVGEVMVFGAMLIMMIILALVILYYIHHLFMSIRRNNTPFTDESVKDLKTIAILMLVCAIVTPIVSGAVVYALDIGTAARIDFNPFTLFVAFMVYVLSLVFSYGTALQKESDELL